MTLSYISYLDRFLSFFSKINFFANCLERSLKRIVPAARSCISKKISNIVLADSSSKKLIPLALRIVLKTYHKYISKY